MTDITNSTSSTGSSILSALTAPTTATSSASTSGMSVGSNTGSLSSLGIGSGLNVTSIISSIMAADSQPLTDLQNAASAIQTKISTVGQLSSLTSTMESAAGTLSSPSFWDQTTATSANTAVATATTVDGSAAVGTYAVTCSQLAMGQTVTSPTALSSASSTIDSGTMTISLGTWDQTTTPPTFTASTATTPPPAPVTITIPPTANTLQDIADAINGAGAGVTASIINDKNGARLSISSSATGSDSGFKITTTDDNPGGGSNPPLSSLSYDPSAGASSLTLNQSAQDAMATINDIPVESSSNTLTNVTNGLTIGLISTSTTPVDVTVATDKATMTSSITTFVNAYNALNSAIRAASAASTSSSSSAGTASEGGPLQGDPTLISFQQQLFGVLNTQSTASTTFNSLSALGITVQTDGSLATNGTTLANALSNPQQVKALMTATGSTQASTGLMVQFANVAASALGPGGMLAGEQQGLQSQLTTNQQQQSDEQTHLNQEQQMLQAQYEALDTTMSQMSALSTYVTQQMASLSASTS